MSGEAGLPISKPVSLLKKSIKVNFKDFSKALGKAGVDAAFGKWDSLAGDGVEALAALGLGASLGEVTWLLVYRALLQAMTNLVKEKKELESENFDFKALCTQINSALENSSLSINKKFFDYPAKDPILELVKQPFIKWLRSSGLNEAEAEAISYRLPVYFASALHDEWGNHSKDYAVLKEKLDTPFTQANERAQAWLRYSTWLQKQVEEPLFLEAFSLKQVYVPLRAYYNRKIEGQKEEESDGRITESKQYERVVVDLEKELESWLNKANRLDAIRLISGGPGSGKSSFAKIFAAKQAEKFKLPILFIPLHHFEPSDDLIDALGKFIRSDGFLTHNPLAPDNGESRLIIIFDGLDELAMQGKIAEKTAQDFVREVQRKVERFNMREIRLQVLISGRELVMQANRSDFRQPQQILHVLPYFVSDEDRKNYVDERKLLEQDQRQLWWQSYGSISGNGYTGLPTELDQGNLIEITAQPLLNYLVALSLKRGELQFSKETNLNVIYADLLKAIYERGWAGHQHTALRGIEERDFIRILEEIALASWHGDGRTTTVREIEDHCENSGLKSLLQRFQEGFRDDSRASVTRLLTAFYFRHSGYRESEETFEFTHKSFGEYLTAKRIVREVRLIHKKLQERQNDPDEGWDERDSLQRWVLLCGPSVMDEYVFDFIADEIRLQGTSTVADWQKTLSHLLSFMLQHGMPMERLSTSTFLYENFMARNSEEALLLVLNACACLTKELSDVQYPYPTAFGIWISRLVGQRVDTAVLSLKCLNFLNLQRCILYCKDFLGASFEGADLSNAELAQANLFSTNLYQANLKKANLFRANLEKANLEKANLEEVNLERAYLVGANLKRVNLRRANIIAAQMWGANMQAIDLRKANLEYANLSESDLRRANLKEAILKQSYLREANFEGANLEGASLEGANLEGANLEGANLKNTNFEGANLKGTILEGKY